MLDKCNKGEHKMLNVIARPHEVEYEGCSELEWTIVRWCEICGSISVDLEHEKKTVAGGIVPIKYPELFREIVAQGHRGPICLGCDQPIRVCGGCDGTC